MAFLSEGKSATCPACGETIRNNPDEDDDDIIEGIF